jgi:MscS family membrane protein
LFVRACIITVHTRLVARALFFALILVLAAPVAGAQDAPTTNKRGVLDPYALRPPASAEVTHDDLLGRSTPQGTVTGFLRAMQREDYERAVDYLNTRQTGTRAQQLAVELNHILDRGMSTVVSMLSSKPEGSLQHGIPPNRELIGGVTIKNTEYEILLERVQKENSPPIWLFSAETLEFVPNVYAELDAPWIERYLPTVMTDTRVLGSPLYRWALTLLFLPLAFLLARLFTGLIFYLVREPLRRRLGETVMIRLRRIRKPLVLLFLAVAVYIISIGSPSLVVRLFWTFMTAIMAVVSLTWITLYAIDAGAVIIERRRPEAAKAVVLLSATLLKALAILIGFVVIFHYFGGINLTAVVAGLGVGGIAVAFAAQKTIENFFGGVFIVWDKPVRLGDFCRVGEYTGTVEHIGLRSTLIRTLNRTVVSIPNGQLSVMSVENFALRDRFLFRHTLNLRYETTAEQLRFILAKIRELLYQHPRVDSMVARIRFIAFGHSSLDVEIFAHVLEKDYNSFLAVQEDLLLRIMDLVGESGSGFAFSSQTLYIAKDGGLDKEKSRQATVAVGRWRDEGELPFPDHAPAMVSQIDGTLDYPADGSVLRREQEKQGE